MTKEEAKEIERLIRANERYEILNDVLRYLTKTRQRTLNYDEIEEIVKNRDSKKSK